MTVIDGYLRGVMIEKNLSMEISGLPNFPWQTVSFQDLIKMIDNKQINAAVYYAPELGQMVMNRKEVIFTYFQTAIITLIPITFLVISIWTKKWIYLLGISEIFIAMAISSPWAKKLRQTFFIISLCFLLFSLYIGNNTLAVLLGGLFLSILMTKFTRDFLSYVLLKEIKKSELLFCYTFYYGILLLQDSNNEKIYTVR